MKNKIKKWHMALMSFLTLFIAVFASLFSLRADTVDEETGEVLTDNWELNTVFYDSTVDNGKTPLTEINWDASDGGYDEGTPRVITVQINYKNNSAVTTYQPGELEIAIPHLLYNSSSECNYTVTTGANDDSHTGYDWNKSYNDGTYIFTNAYNIEEKANLEGSIQLIYNITPRKETPEKFLDECIHNHSRELQAVLSYNKINELNEIENINIISNILTFSYTRTYIHPWNYIPYTLNKTAQKISSMDGLPIGNYIWVKYYFTITRHSSNTGSYPLIPATNLKITDIFPSECIVLNDNMEQLIAINNMYEIPVANINTVVAGGNSTSVVKTLLVGYPTTIYNEDNNNLNITNYAELFGKYENKSEIEKLDDSRVSLNLNNFMFNYEGDLYTISKTSHSSSNHYSTFMLDKEFDFHGSSYQIDNDFSYQIIGSAVYTGHPLTVRLGDDLLYITDSNGNYRRLLDDEYYLYKIALPKLRNGNNITIPYDKYEITLYVRYANSTTYLPYLKLDSSNSEGQIITFSPDEKIVGFYYEFLDLTESLKITTEYTNIDNVEYTIKPNSNISEAGKVYNFNYIQVYINGILQNQPTIDSYNNFITKDEIAQFDMQTYGTYLQRDYASINYNPYTVISPQFTKVFTSKNMSDFIQDADNELFTGNTSISMGFRGPSGNNLIAILDNYEHYQKVYFDYKDDLVGVSEFSIYDLLPEGMELKTTANEMLNSMSSESSYLFSGFYNLDGTKPFTTQEEFIKYMKNHSTINIIENWNNTNRTKIEWKVDLSNAPLVYIYEYGNALSWKINFNYSISYDSYLEHGNTWTNCSYLVAYYSNGNNVNNYLRRTTDKGTYDSEASDINENGTTSEYLSCMKVSKNITSVISTHQDVTTYVKTDQSNYSTGIVDASCDSEYEYKLRVRTGAADVTNLVIYTSIEEAQPKRTRWYGEFLGVDTTYAENKGYTVKVWYSPNKTVGTLTEDTSWLEYDETTVDKSKVKSLAFQYLVKTDDTTGTGADAIEPAVLPANSLTYVLIKMKSPADESETRLARMDCWTQWNAIDEFDQPVDFITGINSNVVKVALPNSIKADDLPSISLKFIKEIQGETSDFKNLNLNKADEHIFMIRLTNLSANDDGTYNQVTGLLSSTQGLVITQIPIGTYLLEELGDNYFDFVNFTDNNDSEIIIEGVTFEKTDQGYIITVSEDLAETVEFNIKVTNKTEDESFYEDKEYKENLFLKNKIESGEDPETPI